MRTAPLLSLALALAVPACDKAPPPAPSPPPPAPPPPPPAYESCGALDCRAYDATDKAFLAALESAPLVLGVGEAHAQKGTEGVDSSAKRFTRDLLPLLKDEASDLLVELMMPPKGCAAKTEDVRAKQKPVTEKQAEGDQGEYVAMGTEARRLGMVPDLLRPTCADMDAISKAGREVVTRSLETIRRLASTQAQALLARPKERERMVVLYGGALHCDAAPPPERASWSYGPELMTATGGRYVELDLFVPEFIDDSESWKKFEWYSHFDRARAAAGKTTLFHPRPETFVLIFPETRGR